MDSIRSRRVIDDDPDAGRLRGIAAAHPELFACSPHLDEQTLQQRVAEIEPLLIQSGINRQNVCQLLLILSQTDFYQLQSRGTVTGAELSVTAKQLYRKTGLTPETVCRQLVLLCDAVGILPQIPKLPQFSEEKVTGEALPDPELPASGFMLPPESYAAQREALDQLWEKREYDKLLEQSLALCSMGIPTAQFYAGCCYLYGCGADVDASRAATLLKKAASGGEMRAYNALGDYYLSAACTLPNKAELAYRCYTVFGGEPIDQKQRQRIDIMRQNRLAYAKNWMKAGGFWLLQLVFLIAAGLLYGPVCMGWGIAVVIVNLLLGGGCYLLQKWMPHTDVMRRFIPFSYLLFGIWLLGWIAGITA